MQRQAYVGRVDSGFVRGRAGKRFRGRREAFALQQVLESGAGRAMAGGRG